MKIMLLDANTDCYITVAKTNYKCMLIPSMTKLSNYKSHYGLLLHFLDGILQIKYPKPCFGVVAGCQSTQSQLTYL